MKSAFLCRLRLYGIPLLLLPALAIAQPPRDPVSASLEQRIEQLRAGEELQAGGDVIASRIVLPALYEQRDARPVEIFFP